MLLPINEIPKDGLSKHFTLDVRISDPDVNGPVSVHLTILKAGETVYIKGNLQASISQFCSRCLKGYSTEVDTFFEVRYLPIERASAEKEHELTKEELDISYYSDEILDLNELVTEQLFLLLPMKSLCKATCKGLCSVCGIDLNESQCTCHVEQIDPRWVALKKLQKGVKNA
jgi:uncharacterized protein